jgi:hypothetical protein
MDFLLMAFIGGIGGAYFGPLAIHLILTIVDKDLSDKLDNDNRKLIVVCGVFGMVLGVFFV